MRSKRGDEYVEAALVLPLVILAIAGFISLTLFCYGCLQAQCELQEALLTEAAGETGLFQVLCDDTEFSFPITGIDRLEFRKEYSARLTVCDEDALVRAGGAVHDLFQ